MVSAKGFVASKIGTVAIIGGLIIGAAFLAKRFNVGNQVVGSLRAFGQTTGQSIGAPFTGLVEGFGEAGKELGQASRALSEGFQKSVCETLGVCGPCGFFFCPETKDVKITTTTPRNDRTRERRPLPGKSLDITSVFNSLIPGQSTTKSAINREITFKTQNPSGFGSFAESESALAKAIADSKAKFPQFFK